MWHFITLLGGKKPFFSSEKSVILLLEVSIKLHSYIYVEHTRLVVHITFYLSTSLHSHYNKNNPLDF